MNHFMYPILPNNNTSPSLLCIRNTRSSGPYSRKSRRPEHDTGGCMPAYVIGSMSLTLGERCLEQLCRVQVVQHLVSPAMYRTSNLWCPLMRRSSKGSMWVRNHLQSVDIKIGRASCPMQSLATKPVTGQTCGNSRVIFFSWKCIPE